jgi:hypothetical protein
MTKSKTKTYRVMMRYSVWMEFPLNASSFDEAVTAAKLIKPEDTIAEFATNVDVVDIEKLPGFGVVESWE